MMDLFFVKKTTVSNWRQLTAYPSLLGDEIFKIFILKPKVYPFCIFFEFPFGLQYLFR